jgi:hypothetical protein
MSGKVAMASKYSAGQLRTLQRRVTAANLVDVRHLAPVMPPRRGIRLKRQNKKPDPVMQGPGLLISGRRGFSIAGACRFAVSGQHRSLTGRA